MIMVLVRYSVGDQRPILFCAHMVQCRRIIDFKYLYYQGSLARKSNQLPLHFEVILRSRTQCSTTFNRREVEFSTTSNIHVFSNWKKQSTFNLSARKGTIIGYIFHRKKTIIILVSPLWLFRDAPQVINMLDIKPKSTQPFCKLILRLADGNVANK